MSRKIKLLGIIAILSILVVSVSSCSKEKKIVGKWNASIGQDGGETKFFDGWIELKDDLTGMSSFDNPKSFTWSYKEIMEGQYYFDVNANGNHSGMTIVKGDHL